MKTELARVGARGTDSVQVIDAEQAKRLAASGIDFCVRYLGSATSKEVDGILDAGLAFMPVTFAARFEPFEAVSALAKLSLPRGCTVWLDIESDSVYRMPPLTLHSKVSQWAKGVQNAGYEAGAYIGSPQPLTSKELWALPVTRYWRAPSRVVDRHGDLADPDGGWCMIQLWPSVTWAGAWVDIDVIQQDYRSRLPSWVVQ